MKLFLIILNALYFIPTIKSQGMSRRPGYGDGDQDWGWYEIREGVDLFYWLFYTQAADVYTIYKKPLVIWLSCQPGISPTGYGNFGEIGPQDVNGTKRPFSWVNYVNLLFVDNPANTGYSKTTSQEWLPINTEEISNDMVLFLIKFYEKHPEFNRTPLYIFGESYNGKLAVEIAKQLYAAIKRNMLDADFRGLGLGSPWISPIDTMMAWASYLFELGMVDETGHDDIAKAVKMLQNSLDKSDYIDEETKRLLTNFFEDAISELIKNKLDLTNILNPIKTRETGLSRLSSLIYDIKKRMETDVQKTLNIPENIQYNIVTHTNFHDIEVLLKSSTYDVKGLLDYTNLTVAIYNGQLDAAVPISGTLKWINRLQWSGSFGWKNAQREPLILDNTVEGYVKNHKNLYFYWIYHSGHYVAVDNPKAAVEVLRRVTKFDIDNDDD